MKRVFAFMLALVLVLSLRVTAFADENTGSITITNATNAQSYAPYKIFDASISGGETGGFTYTITKGNQFFDDMFGDPNDPTNKFDSNPYFIYNDDDGSIRKRATAADADVLEYLKSLIYTADTADKDNDGNTTELVVKDGLTPEQSAIIATSKQVVFDDLPYGYYLVTSSLGTTVTINSTDPDVVVIDKNQKPGDNFTKLVWDEDAKKWVVNSSANIGDIVDFQVSFHATNYNGEKQVRYYTVGDNKGNALWVEFNSVEVWVNGVKLDRGYYHGVDGTSNTGEWEYFGTWTDAEKANINNAQWFLVHRGFDDFDIVIPWMSDYTFEGTATDFSLTFGEDAESIYASSANVVLKYKASVEPGADIENGSNLFNTADLSWKDETIVTPPGTPTTNLAVHALGVTKADGSNGDLLAGAVFEIYSDAACTKPVYVIPTNVEGVYILDDLKTIVSGEHRETSRKKYEKHLAEYLGADYVEKKTQKNVITTQVNGKLVVLGLEEGTYYLKETAAPDGYNKLAAAVAVTIGKDTPTVEFAFDVDAEGKVVTENAVKTEIYKKVVNAPVTNNKGVELPSTGGEGTMMMITIGTMVAMVFAVLLITHKKMSVYHD